MGYGVNGTGEKSFEKNAIKQQSKRKSDSRRSLDDIRSGVTELLMDTPDSLRINLQKITPPKSRRNISSERFERCALL